MEDDLDRYIRTFFRWFRCRLANVTAISTLAPPSSEPFAFTDFLPDQHVLIGSGIDALAKTWAEAGSSRLVRNADGASVDVVAAHVIELERRTSRNVARFPLAAEIRGLGDAT